VHSTHLGIVCVIVVCIIKEFGGKEYGGDDDTMNVKLGKEEIIPLDETINVD
jgi:hypothetical protein